jgi:ribosomal protein S18 acetylase RimI-like enzyme
MLSIAVTPRPGLATDIDRGELMTGYETAECCLVAHDRDADSIVGVLAAAPPAAWLAKMGDHGIGTAERQTLAQVIAKVHGIAVDSSFRRRGVGRKLMLSAVAYYRSRDYVWMYGQFRDEDLLAFYRGFGFEISEPDDDLIAPFGSGNLRMHGDRGERWFSMLL